MATTSFKRKKYGQVKPVKAAKVKLKKPDIRELTRYYAAIAKYGVWQQLDNVCYAMHWWDGFLKWYEQAVHIDYRTTSQARKITDALQYRKAGVLAPLDKTKIDAFVKSMYYLEGLTRMIGFKVPLLKKYVDAGEQAAKKNKGVLDALEPRFSKITGLLAKMFSSCPLSIVVVPQIVDGVTGKDIPRKLDHTKNTIYYSRRQVKAMKWTLRNEGYLALAIDEAWWLSRAMSFGKDQFIPEHTKWLKTYNQLMNDFDKWARRADTPTRLAKKPAKPKKQTEEELKLATAEIISMEPMEKHVLQN